MELWLMVLIVAVMLFVLLMNAHVVKKRSSSGKTEDDVLTVTIQEKQFDDEIYAAIIVAMHEELNSRITNYNITSIREL